MICREHHIPFLLTKTQKTMILDILTPGDCMDSYSSREISFGHEISCLQDVLNVLKCEFENGRHNSFDGKPLFAYYDLYIYDNDYNRLAIWEFDAKKFELEVHSPSEVVHMSNGDIGIRYPMGDKRYRIPIYYPARAYKTN